MPPDTRNWDVEFRAASSDDTDGNDDGRNFSGYAAVFDTPTDIGGWEGAFQERMAKGAFKKTLKARNPVMQFDHGRDSRVGSTPIGNYTTVKEDDNGLYCEGRLFDNPVVEPVRQAIEAQSVRGMSIKFHVNRDQWRDSKGKLVRPDELGQLLYEPGERGPLQREIREVDLMEAGPVVHPAYPTTTASVRSFYDQHTPVGDERGARADIMAAHYARTIDDPDGELEERTEEETHEETQEGHLAAETSEQRDDETSTEETSVDAQEDPASRASVQGDGSTEKANRAKSPEQETTSATTQRKAGKKMKTLDELKARQAEIEVRLAELGELETRDEAGDDEFDALAEERDTTIATIKKIEHRAEVLKSLAVSDEKHVERGDKKGAPAFHKKQDDIYDLGELRSLAYSGEDFLTKVSDNAKRAVESAKYGVRNAEEAQTHVTELLEDVDNEARDLAKRMLLTGSPEYAKAFAKVVRHGNDAMCTTEERQALIRAQALGTDSSGGFAVPFQLDPTVILTNAGVVNPIRDLARVETIVGKQWQGVTSAGTTVTRGSEASTAPDSSFSLAQPVVSTNRVQGFVPFSIEIDLSWAALQREITAVLVDAKAREEDSFLTGDGVTGTQPEGIYGAATSDFTTATAATFVLADLYNYVAALPPRWEDNATFLAHKSIFNLIRQFDTAGGAALWAHLGDGTPGRLLDFPVSRSSAMASAVAASAKIALFGDFRQFLIVDRIGMNVELVPHIFDASNGNRPTGQRGVYAVWMNNSKILVPSAFKRLVVHA